MVDKFLKALTYVSVPAAMLKYYVSKMSKSKKESDIKAIQETVITSIFSETPNSKNLESMQGNMFKTILKYKKNIEKILSKNSKILYIKHKNYFLYILVSKKMKDELTTIDKELSALLKADKKFSVLLKDYCPWLANFSANKLNLDLEIPGQYTGDKLPLPQHHIKISGFYPHVSTIVTVNTAS